MINFEKLAIASIIEGKLKVSDVSLDMFTSKNPRFVFKLIKAYQDRYGTLPSLEVIQATINTQIEPDKAKVYCGYVEGLPEGVTELPEAILDGLKEDRGIKVLDSKIEELVSLVETRDITKARKVLKELLVSTSDVDNKVVDAKDAEFNVDNIMMLDSCITDVVNKLQGVTLISAKSGCVDKDTEYLTRAGWKKFSEYSEGEEVLQWSENGTTKFVKPMRYIKLPYDKMYHFKGSNVDMVLSKEHRVPYIQDGKLHVTDPRGFFDILRCTNTVSFPEASGVTTNTFISAVTVEDFVPEDGFMYCFEVPSSFLVVRRNNKIFVTGNCGKSILAMNQAMYSYKQGYDILYINLELSQNEAMARILSKELDVPFEEIYTDLDEREVAYYNEKKREIFSRPNKFKMVNSSLDAQRIVDLIKEEHTTGLQLVVIDYLQIVENENYEEQWKFLSNFVKDLHRLTLELGICVLTPIQINEVTEKGGTVNVTARGSQELNFTASLWFHLHQSDEEASNSLARMFTIKSRHSKKKTYVLETDFGHMRFNATGMVM